MKKNKPEHKPTNSKSKFVFDSLNFILISGKMPKQKNTLYKGENHEGKLMEAVGFGDGTHTFYWGWS